MGRIYLLADPKAHGADHSASAVFGGYALLLAQIRHYAMAKTAAIVQVHGMGPFALTYVNPADDPTQRAK